MNNMLSSVLSNVLGSVLSNVLSRVLSSVLVDARELMMQPWSLNPD
ncbi:hypothetical protein [Shewanella sp. T24-MNA-CIBAN-0130]